MTCDWWKTGNEEENESYDAVPLVSFSNGSMWPPRQSFVTLDIVDGLLETEKVRRRNERFQGETTYADAIMTTFPIDQVGEGRLRNKLQS